VGARDRRRAIRIWQINVEVRPINGFDCGSFKSFAPRFARASSTQAFDASFPASVFGRGLELAVLLCLRSRGRSLRFPIGNAEEAVVVADDKIAGLDDHAVERDRTLSSPPVLVGAAMRDARGEDWKVFRLDQPRSRMAPLITTPATSDLIIACDNMSSPTRAFVKSPPGVDDDHVAGLGDHQGLVDHQIIAGTYPHCQTGPARPRPHGRDAAAAAAGHP